jgi:thioredoxin-like negative regulator of GroEL
MERHIAQNKFGQADMLFQQGRFDESLALLDELDQAFPDSPNVMFPRARCLLEIGETNEALDILDSLALHHQHQEAMALKGEVEDALTTLTQPPATEARHRDGPTPQQVKAMRSSSHAGSVPDGGPSKSLVLIVALVVLVGLLALLLVVLSS